MNKIDIENPVIKKFREEHQEKIRLIFTCLKSENPEHQVARILYNLLAEHEALLWQKIEEMRREEPDDRVPYEMGIDIINAKTIIKADTQGYNQALSEAQSLLTNKK